MSALRRSLKCVAGPLPLMCVVCVATPHQHGEGDTSHVCVVCVATTHAVCCVCRPLTSVVCVVRLFIIKKKGGSAKNFVCGWIPAHIHTHTHRMYIGI